MLRFLKTFGWMAALLVVAHSASAFSLWGIREPYQIDQLGYIGDYSFQPHNLGEEFRWNIPTVYYTYDQSFYDYFGAKGVEAVDGAAKILTSVFSTNVSSWSADLSEFSYEGSQMNYSAAALKLFDLKSCALEVLVERLGLLDPEAFSWTLRNRVAQPGTCQFIYTVIKRNFDPLTWEPSVYVNGNLLTYTIVENCPARDQAIAVPSLVDRDGLYSTPIATPKVSVANELYYGFYHTCLTRDDIGGFRYLYRTNNVNLESAGPDTATHITNNVSQLLWTSNLTVFAEQALHTNAASLQGLYPDLVITSTSNFFAVVWVTNYIPYFTNYPFDPVGTLPHVAFVTNRVPTVQTYYRHTFGNLATVVYTNGGWFTKPIYDVLLNSNKMLVTVETSYTTNSPWLPANSGVVLTNTSTKSYLTNGIAGEYIILPTNACDMAILSPILTQTNRFTNNLVNATNIIIIGDTNLIGTNAFFYNQDLITYSTNHVFVVYPISCAGTNAAWRQGIDKVQFIRRDYDSLLGRYWTPITNRYTVVVVTNNVYSLQVIDRVVSQPDILFSAADLVTGPTASPIINPTVQRSVPNAGTNGLAPYAGTYGPGTIEPSAAGDLPIHFVFNKVGPLYYNETPYWMDEATATLDYIWASFDGTTNPPVIYPVGSSITNLENQIVMTLSATDLLSGSPVVGTTIPAAVNANCRVQFSAVGARGSYTFSLAPHSGNLPAGFVQPTSAERLLPEGIIQGVPLAVGTYEIIVRVTDTVGQRFVDRTYQIIVSP